MMHAWDVYIILCARVSADYTKMFHSQIFSAIAIMNIIMSQTVGS